jgi:hypothetical protein
MRQNHRGPVVAPEWFRRFSGSERDQSLHDPAFLIRQRSRSFRSILTGTRRRKTPFSGWSRIDVKSGVEKQLATLDPPPDSILAGRISLHPDGNRLAVSFVRQHGKIYMLEGFDESTSWFDRLMRRF